MTFITEATKGSSVACLDHGFVRLVDSMGTDISVVRAARVSYDAEWRAGTDGGSDARLIRYLWKNKHTSPFEAVEFQFEVKAPIFVFRQWHRHRTWSFNELSARYRELPSEFYIPRSEHIGQQSKDNKQMRDMGGGDEFPSASLLIPDYANTVRNSFECYRSLLQSGWPRELARMVLPVSTYSHMFAKVDLRNLLHFLDLRLHSHAQNEIRVYAEAIRDLIRPIVPECMAAYENASTV